MWDLQRAAALMAQEFAQDPGVLAQLAGIENGAEIFKAQCRAEIEAFDAAGILQVYGDYDGILAGYFAEDLLRPEFMKAMSLAADTLLKTVDRTDLIAIQTNALKAAAITQADWYTRYTNGKNVYILQIIAVRGQMRGKGVMRKMLEPLIEACGQKDVPIALQTHNLENIEKYKHFGFEVLETVKSEELNITCSNLLRL